MKSILLCILLCFISCSRQQATRSKFVFSYTIEDVSTAGGAFIKCLNKDDLTLAPLYLQLDEQGNTEIPYGNWDLYVVVYAGPDLLSGTTQCGALLNVDLNSPNMEFDLDVESSICSDDPFPNVMNEINDAFRAKWNSALWNESTWGP